jgi:hypothetical protein
VVWHVLTKGEVDEQADAEQVAASLFRFAYKVGVNNLPDGQSASQFVRAGLDRLGIMRELTKLRWCSLRFKLPSSSLSATPQTALHVTR